MKINNVHERALKLSPEVVGSAIDRLAGTNDIIWPRNQWPPMEFDGGLRTGAAGGHGGVRYFVQDYVPGQRAVFQFDGTGFTSGLDGRHYFEVVPRRDHVVIRHVIDAECSFHYWWKWYFLIQPLHDALLENGLDQLENELTGSKKVSRWSPWVKFIRANLAIKARTSNHTP